jgi:hypothetical protein
MAVIRINKTSDYTIMSNNHFKEREMSLKAKGLLSLMLSLPDNWDYSIAGLVTLSKDGRDSVISALTELEELSYLKRTQDLDEKGRFKGYNYEVFEHPYAKNPFTENPYTEKPNTENPIQLNTKESNTKESITQDIYTPVVDMYHRICISLPSIRELTDKRKKAIKARLKQYSMEQIEEVFILAESSDFLKGKKGDWKATFDWLMNANNFVKVLEGTYNDKTPTPTEERKGYGGTYV